jgi:hypothetical protein
LLVGQNLLPLFWAHFVAERDRATATVADE